MIIFAHRGLWKEEKEKNTLPSFKNAFENGFGIETDLRDYGGKIVISHNIPKGNEPSFEKVLEIMDGRNLPLALNIKADGMGVEIKRILKKYNQTNYFTFDMSIPEMIVQRDLGMNYFTGISDYVRTPICFNEAKGVWLDSFDSDWFDDKIIDKIIKQNKNVCIVSPDLHGREYIKIWKRYKKINSIMLCTDHPLEARDFFSNEEN